LEGLESVNQGIFERVFRIDDVTGHLEVCAIPNESKFKLQIATNNPKILFQVVQRVRGMFDLESDPILIANSFAAHPFLNSLWTQFPGLRVPRGFDPFETSISTILGQLVSVDQARRLIQQLIETYGDRGVHPIRQTPLSFFPTPKVLASIELNELRTTANRKQAIREFSRQVVEGGISLSSAQDPGIFKEKLLQVPGIGEWTAQYIALRALGDTDAFPKSDLILKRALEKHPDMDLNLIQPWRGYAAIYLWKQYAEVLSKKPKLKRRT
jgi:AraC family transcriptional regulator of adaptative response / DNA-3-methyladenine glycosylase II